MISYVVYILHRTSLLLISWEFILTRKNMCANLYIYKIAFRNLVTINNIIAIAQYASYVRMEQK